MRWIELVPPILLLLPWLGQPAVAAPPTPPEVAREAELDRLEECLTEVLRLWQQGAPPAIARRTAMLVRDLGRREPFSGVAPDEQLQRLSDSLLGLLQLFGESTELGTELGLLMDVVGGADADSAAACLRDLHHAQQLYHRMGADEGFAFYSGELVELGDYLLIPPELRDGLAYGYRFRLEPPAGGYTEGFQAWAEPVGGPGPSLYVDEQGEIRIGGPDGAPWQPGGE